VSLASLTACQYAAAAAKMAGMATPQPNPILDGIEGLTPK